MSFPGPKGRFSLSGERGAPPPQFMLGGLFPTAHERGEEKGQGTCANLEPRLGADARERTAEPWFPS